jgi:hypothetical protein
MAQSALGSRSLVDVNNLLGGCLIQQLAQVIVLNLGFVKLLGFDGISKLFSWLSSDATWQNGCVLGARGTGDGAFWHS